MVSSSIKISSEFHSFSSVAGCLYLSNRYRRQRRFLRIVGILGHIGSQPSFAFRDIGDIEVYIRSIQPRLDRWETEKLQDLVETVPFEAVFQVAFTHAGRIRIATVQMGWLKIRLPDTHQILWTLVAEDSLEDRTLVLLTNVPLDSVQQVKQVYDDWRLRTRIEHGYRFDQEQGLDVEDMRVRSLERMRRLFILVLLAAQFVFYLMDDWPPRAVLWLRQLGGKLGLSSNRDGPYIVLRGLRAMIQTIATLTFLAIQPFHHEDFSYG